jgi:MinD-like ATPase involved in chromosome partitioning or flagellar assembly
MLHTDSNSELISTNQQQPPLHKKRVVFTMGGKGGVGKTGVVLALAEWFQSNEIPTTLIDLDSENKAAGSLKHYHSSVHPINIYTPAGLDVFIDYLTDQGPSVILADMGGGSGQIALDWFDTMHPEIAPLGVAFTAIGVITPDPASVQSLLAWASRLRDRVQYLVVENACNVQPDFSYWHDAEQARHFRDEFHPLTLSMEFRVPSLENAARQHGCTLGQVAQRAVSIPILQKTSFVLRAQGYNRRLFLEFDKAAELLLP